MCICREEADKQLEQMKDQVEIEQRRCRQLDDQYRALKSVSICLALDLHLHVY